MPRILNVDFYKVTISQDKYTGKNLDSILKQAKSMPQKDRVKEVRNTPTFLHILNYGWNECWEGEIVRLRMNNLPVKGSFSGNVEDINLADDEGIGEQTAFIYHPETSILALQSTQHGPSMMHFTRYFESIINCSDCINLDLVLQKDAIKRLEKMQTVSKFKVRIAKVENMKMLATEEHGVKEIIELSEYLEAPTIDVEISNGRSKENALSVTKIKEMTQSLFRINKNQSKTVKTLRISGSSNDNEKIYIDLIKDRMRESVSLNQSSKSRNIPYGEKQFALREAWNRRESEILSLYKPN